MEFLDLAKKRYSAREYLLRPVEEEKLMKILEAGRVAPTAANRQPQRILVLRSEEALGKAAKAANTFGAPLVLVICADHSQAWVRRWDGMQACHIDASIVTDHMMLEAADLGLGSVWICAFQPDVLREEFALPEQLEPVNLLAIGYAAGEYAPTCRAASPNRHGIARKPLEETVSFDIL